MKRVDYGDVDIDLYSDESFKRVEKDALNMIDKEQFCIFIGGDHSVSIPLQKNL